MIYKILLGLYRAFIKVIARLNHKLYMKLYLHYLKSRGIVFKGKPIYIGASTVFDGTDYSLFEIGDNVVISSECRFLTHDFSISRAVVTCGNQYRQEFPLIKPIKIGDNSFIGARTILLPGTTIGKNVIVGAGSVVRGNVPDNVIVIGNPAIVVSSVEEWYFKTLNRTPALKKYII